ncbi:hypothetical protein [Rufibacter quisquiliarum]|uniref:Uncharacterized protein n=1 Tax=Rufibacter quisquiliarum TaxID=1549639 RepID=A0A839GR83_9BACT|nr:hypothetical protein [Rufibacter quisquiliarum]MBA9077397.1 hypothetical protein [Rufibacter quisquiliarum]
MRNYFFTFLLLCLLLGQSSCNSIRREVALPKFIVDSAPKNRFIVNRKPLYGDGRPDGCVVERQIQLSFATDGGPRIVGEVKDAKTLEVLPGASVQIYFAGQPNPHIASADSVGRIYLTRLAALQQIEVNSICYRTLHIDLSKKKSLL